VRAGHGENVRGAIDQLSGKRLAAQIANVYASFFANLHCVKTWRLPAHGMHPRRRDLDLFAITKQTAEKALCDGTAANVACADKENTFHDSRRASARTNNLELNIIKSTKQALQFCLCCTLIRCSC